MAKTDGTRGDTPETVGLQLAMAFGQGAGTMPATPEALWATYSMYLSAIKEKIGKWPEIELRTLEYARALGRLAAFNASSNGRIVIDVEDVRAAAPLVRKNRLRPIALCSLTPIKPKAGDVVSRPGQ